MRNNYLSLFSLNFLYPLLLAFSIIVFSNCARHPSVLEVRDSDRAVFRAILAHQAEEIRFFQSYDHLGIACTVVRPESEPYKGVVGLIHGIAARAKLYLPLADSLAKHGFLVYMMDLRGHGYSQGESGYVPSDTSIFNDVLRFYRFIRQNSPEELPFIAMGHSLGTYIWVSTISLYNEIHPDAVVLIAGGSLPEESLRHSRKTEKGDFIRIYPLKLMCSPFFPHIKPVEIVLPDEPGLQSSGFVTHYTLRFLKNSHVSDSLFIKFYTHNRIPLLFIMGEDDEVFPVAEINSAYQLTEGPETEMIVVPDATHTSIIWDGAEEIYRWLNKFF